MICTKILNSDQWVTLFYCGFAHFLPLLGLLSTPSVRIQTRFCPSSFNFHFLLAFSFDNTFSFVIVFIFLFLSSPVTCLSRKQVAFAAESENISSIIGLSLRSLSSEIAGVEVLFLNTSFLSILISSPSVALATLPACLRTIHPGQI